MCECVFVEITSLYTVTFLASEDSTSETSVPAKNNPPPLDPDHVDQTLAEHEDQTSSLLGLQDFTGTSCLGYSTKR